MGDKFKYEQNIIASTIILSMVPICVTYPFFLKYFTKGVVVGGGERMSGRVVALEYRPARFIKSGVFENGKLGAVMKTPTGAGSLEEIKRSVSEAVEYHLVGGADGIAASSAGDFDPYRGVCTFATDNLKGYSGFALKAWLEEKYGRARFRAQRRSRRYAR